MDLQAEWHGVPKWVWIGGALLVLVALVLSRRAVPSPAAGTTGQPTDLGANQAATLQAGLAADSATQSADVQARAGLASSIVQAIRDITISQNANVTQEEIATTQASERLNEIGLLTQPTAAQRFFARHSGNTPQTALATAILGS